MKLKNKKRGFRFEIKKEGKQFDRKDDVHVCLKKSQFFEYKKANSDLVLRRMESSIYAKDDLEVYSKTLGYQNYGKKDF